MTAKEKKAEYDKEYRLKNLEKIKIRTLEYRNNRKDINKEYQKNYDILNKEKVSERKKKYYKNNKSKILEICKKYRNNNPKEKSGLKGTGNYNITLAERHKDVWINTKIFLYKLKMTDINNQVFFKYGLTKNIKNRLYQIPYNVEILELIELNKYEGVYKEKKLLEQVTSYIPLTKFGGHTECFIL